MTKASIKLPDEKKENLYYMRNLMNYMQEPTLYAFRSRWENSSY